MRKWLKPALLFGLVGVLHFVLSVAGIVVALPAAFDAQAGFWNAPVKITLAWTAAVSALFGIAAVLVTYAAGRGRRAGRRPAG
jgi:hypothetical protein